ncbi:pectate lyase [Sphaerisporangium melleum]|uniref:Pectate lyase n=1 Tax=Sphaerisporangium melleum TaxID=321316 RepID=A0A917R256_9ACTN|nr:pectate lyase [Sphaerisporangium melleum]GGK83301.1 pectate lyase [Sphaerisporangium melleum]GII69260.1 pectate lyase [Sphaerisporangium melleum]
MPAPSKAASTGLAVLAAALCAIVPAAAPAASAATGHGVPLGRQTLPAGDGWAAATTGTTGGSAADDAHVHTVRDRRELIAALAGGDPAPKIIYVRGVIDGNTDDSGARLTCDDYATGGYTRQGYLAAYDPAVWGRDTEPSGPMEDARAASAKAQTAHIKPKVGSNTTIIGVGDAVIKGLNLHVDKADNVIIRNIHFQDAHDCFPQWDPTDGAEGNWNSLYDNISVTGSTHVWVDHNDFDDGNNPDSAQPLYFGRPYQVHDGELDVTAGSDLVTISWNRFADHDKTMLIGSTNNPASDRGKLNVTVHHNVFDTILQRAPRVRFGQVHVYNNFYDVPSPDGYEYSLGAGVESRIYAENNFFRLGAGVDPGKIIYNWGGTTLHAQGTLVASGVRVRPLDILAAHNATHDPDISGEVGWTPTLHTRVDPTVAVPVTVPLLAGAGRLR